MSQPAKAVPQESTADSQLLYEQPLNERMRTFLRLEFLYKQLLYQTEQSSDWSSRGAVSSLLDVVAILSRGDVRGDVLKELERQIFMLDRLRQADDIDAERLHSVMQNLQEMRGKLNAVGPKYLQVLRDDEFLNAIRHRSSIPGGTCAFDIPEYSHWLRQDFDRRSADIAVWMGAVRPLCESVTGLLWLVRNSRQAARQIATSGVYQHSMKRDNAMSLVRINLPAGSGLATLSIDL